MRNAFFDHGGAHTTKTAKTSKNIQHAKNNCRYKAEVIKMVGITNKKRKYCANLIYILHNKSLNRKAVIIK